MSAYFPKPAVNLAREDGGKTKVAGGLGTSEVRKNPGKNRKQAWQRPRSNSDSGIKWSQRVHHSFPSSWSRQQIPLKLKYVLVAAAGRFRSHFSLFHSFRSRAYHSHEKVRKNFIITCINFFSQRSSPLQLIGLSYVMAMQNCASVNMAT